MYFIVDKSRREGERVTRTNNWEQAFNALKEGHTVINASTFDELSTTPTGFVKVHSIEHVNERQEREQAERQRMPNEEKQSGR